MKYNILIIFIAFSLQFCLPNVFCGTIEGRIFFNPELQKISTTDSTVIFVGAFYTTSNFAEHPTVPDFTTITRADMSFSLSNLPDSTYFTIAWVDTNCDGQPEAKGVFGVAENQPMPIRFNAQDSTCSISIILDDVSTETNIIEGNVIYQGKLKYEEIVIMIAGYDDEFSSKRFRYYTKITSPGYFRIANLPDGMYYVFALIDDNRDFEEEAIGFYREGNGLPKLLEISHRQPKAKVNIRMSDIYFSDEIKTAQALTN